MYRMDDTECPAYALNNIKNWGREAYTVWYFVPADIKKNHWFYGIFTSVLIYFNYCKFLRDEL